MATDRGISIAAPSPLLEPLVNDILDVESSERSWLRDVQLKTMATGGWIAVFRPEGIRSYLRWSKGPVQGFFWDAYPDVFDRLGWVIRALVTAPSPVRCLSPEKRSTDGAK